MQWKLTGDADGEFPADGLILDTQGVLCGTAWMGGYQQNGVVFELTR